MPGPTRKSMHHRNRGFTLVELMIVVAIIGILAGVAVPQYKVYVGRSMVTEAIQQMGMIKTAVAEYVQTTGNFSNDLTVMGAPSGNFTFSFVQGISGVATPPYYGIQIIMGGTGFSGIDGNVIFLMSNYATGGGVSVPLTWTCSITDIGLAYSPVAGQYVPSGCNQGVL